jgi:hypothetical protein
MVVLQGDSGIGKSVLLDLIVAVSGRGVSLFPDSIFSRFNGMVAYKSVVAIHEIHSDDLTRKQNAGRLKELIANSTIEIEEKNRPKVAMTNVIHWFAATNEKVPFSLEHGNDRFYFVKCAAPPNPPRMRRFFRKWVPRFKEEAFLDELSAGAKWLVDGLKKKVAHEMEGRAQRQDIWAYLEGASMRPWEQLLQSKLEEVSQPEEGVNHPPVFVGNDIVRLVAKQFPRVGVEDVRRRMNEFGFVRLERADGGVVQKRIRTGAREVLWCRLSDRRQLQERGDFGSLVISGIREAG